MAKTENDFAEVRAELEERYPGLAFTYQHVAAAPGPECDISADFDYLEVGLGIGVTPEKAHTAFEADLARLRTAITPGAIPARQATTIVTSAQEADDATE